MDDGLAAAVIVNEAGEVLGAATQFMRELREENLALKNEMGAWVTKYRRAVKQHHAKVQNDPRWPEALEVLEHWRDVLSPGAKEFLGDRGQNVVDRLKAGHDVETLKRVIDGYAYVPYVAHGRRQPHGTGPQRKIDASLLFMDEKHVQMGLSYWEHGQNLEAVSGPTPTSVPAPGISLSEVGQRGVACAKVGWHVFPVAPKTKVPQTRHGLLDATTDVERIAAWWSKHPDSSLGIRTGKESGLVVLDLDVKNGGGSTLGTMLMDGREWPGTTTDERTLEIGTPSGGTHFYFLHPGVEIRNSAGLLGSGLDIRGDGGYVVAPPSPGYTIRHRGRPARLPEWLRTQLVQRQMREDTQLASGQYDKFMEGVPSGARDDQLLKLGAHLVAKGLPYGEVLQLLLGQNHTFCRPPLPDRQVKKIVDSMIRMDARKAS
jgi:hypothetical protein